ARLDRRLRLLAGGRTRVGSRSTRVVGARRCCLALPPYPGVRRLGPGDAARLERRHRCGVALGPDAVGAVPACGAGRGGHPAGRSVQSPRRRGSRAMTATLVPAGDVWTIGAPRLLAGLDHHEALDYARHIATHGPLPSTDRHRLIGLVEDIALAGRGGAGFPFA